jgi:hypothetical protein
MSWNKPSDYNNMHGATIKICSFLLLSSLCVSAAIVFCWMISTSVSLAIFPFVRLADVYLLIGFIVSGKVLVPAFSYVIHGWFM